MDSRSQRAHPKLSACATASVGAARTFTRRETVGDGGDGSRLIAGDNLGALAWLKGDFEGRFRCVYLDPPFNTGRTFEEYEDSRTPSEWRAFLGERLERVLPLLAEDGAVFLEIDDSELGPAIALCDEVFGRACRVSTVTVVRSASTGHKAKNRGPVNVTDFVLIYERSRGAWRCHPQRRERRGYDRAYSTLLVNPEAPVSRWTFASLGLAFARAAGFETVASAKRALGPAAFSASLESFALARRDRVVRFAQPRYEAVSLAARRAIDASRADPTRVMRLVRPGHSDMILRGGNRVLFLASKVVDTKHGPRLVEPLTNVWDDIPFQGIAREGGVVFSRNKKPERLLERVLLLSTEPGDWVLDPFLGSGTTAAVAAKMGRRWVGVELGAAIFAKARARLGRVVAGADTTGVTNEYGAPRGAGFGVYT